MGKRALLQWLALVLGGAAAAAPGLALACRRPEVSLAGEWVGSFSLGSEWSFIRAHLTDAGGRAQGTLDVPYEYLTGLALADLGAALPRVELELTVGEQKYRFEGRHEDGRISGEVLRGENRGAFSLARVVDVDPKVLAEYSGSYQVAPDRFVYVQTWDELGAGQLAYFDESGEARALYPLSQTSFFTGPGMMAPLPVEASVVFERGQGGNVEGFVWKLGDSAEVVARRVDLHREEAASFRNGEVTLAGTLLLPPGDGPHPAIVVVHGSGDQDRNGSLPFVRFLVRRGIALLVYDKRGVGASTGNWRESSFEDLAADALAAVAWLRSRPGIDPRRIGVFGASQGGWIGPLAASRSGDIAFVISVSGPGVTPAQQDMNRVASEMRSYGLPESDIAEARSLQELVHEVARTGKGWEKLQAAVEASRNKPRFFADLVPPGDHWMWRFWRLIQDHDPVPVLQKVRCPVLSVFGGLDLIVPAEENRGKWEEALRRARHPNYTLIVFPGGNHILLEAETGNTREFPRLRRFVPEYFDTLLGWLQERLG